MPGRARSTFRARNSPDFCGALLAAPRVEGRGRALGRRVLLLRRRRVREQPRGAADVLGAGREARLIIGMLISSGDLLIDEKIPDIDIEANCAHVSINSTNSNRIIDSTSASGLCGREDVKIEPLSDCDSMPDYTIESEIILKIISNIGENQNLFEITIVLT